MPSATVPSAPKPSCAAWLAARCRHLVSVNHSHIANCKHPIDYGLTLSGCMVQDFNNTGLKVGDGGNVTSVIAFQMGGTAHCCVFSVLQPLLLDAQHFYMAIGSGKLSADPFLRFLVDTFCEGRNQPTVREAVFLSTWVVQHVIETNPGGVDGPIRVAVLERGSQGFGARELPQNELDEHQQAIGSAQQSLRDWRDAIQAGNVNSPPLPSPIKP